MSASAAHAQLLRPAIDGLVLDSTRGQAYAMNEAGGIDALGDDRARLRARYVAVQHPMAAEVVRWLDGADTVDGWIETA